MTTDDKIEAVKSINVNVDDEWDKNRTISILEGVKRARGDIELTEAEERNIVSLTFNTLADYFKQEV